jgi:hypothetical protein
MEEIYDAIVERIGSNNLNRSEEVNPKTIADMIRYGDWKLVANTPDMSVLLWDTTRDTIKDISHDTQCNRGKFYEWLVRVLNIARYHIWWLG